MPREPETIVNLRRRLGGQLAALRKAASLTQEQLARVTHYDRTSVAHIEKGRYRADEQFWSAVDRKVGANGALLESFRALDAVCQAHRLEAREAELAEARSKALRLRIPPPENRTPSTEAEELLRGLVDTMKRRGLLQLFGLTATSAVAPGMFDAFDSDEQERVLGAIAVPERVDEQVIAHIETIVEHARVTDHQFGPQAALHTLLAQVKILSGMVPNCPDSLRPRLLSALANAQQKCGWLVFNKNDFVGARRCYEQARETAHQAQDVTRAAYILASMTQLALWMDLPAVGVDYAVAAQTWVARTDNVGVRAFASDTAACAFAAMGDTHAAMRKLEETRTYLPRCGEEPPAPYLYAYSDELHTGRRGESLLALGRVNEAIQVMSGSLDSYTSSAALAKPRDVAVGRIRLSEAHVVAGNIEEAAWMLGSVPEALAQNRSARIDHQIHEVRRTLTPWEDLAAVKQLDERLVASGLR
ncbi:helix-turn-helix domain-containing protein [Actinokineospora iranica]|uniref:Helix-turn-helix domain-containing protein n=1 Tax=Actinokineospora iranica TaxID=1271860 RepID=A0A1G6YU67_9PSEU|nr:helix-turn-helix transcriptional regulator [Actinokineospora iranica]SDD93593.1 Helix-turn-helix domain-containing protein [Actinokineospora iranica]